MMKKVPFMRGTQEAYKEKQRKKFVGQRLRVTPNSWLTPKRWLLIWNFEKGTLLLIFECFQSFSIM